MIRLERWILVFVFSLWAAGFANGQSSDEGLAGGGEYRVGVNDVLDISVIKPQPFASTVTVAPDGAVTFPYIGSIRISGLTLSQIQDEIQTRLADGYMEYPVISVSLRQSNSKEFTIYGQVNRPGTYPIDEDETLLRAITKAGGFIVSGASGRVKLLRDRDGSQEPYIREMEIKEILKGKYADVKISDRDTIIVSIDRFYIYGQVNRPGAYSVENGMKLLQAISVAGGFIESGSTGRVKILRSLSGSGKFTLIELETTEILSGAYPNVTVSPGDTIVITGDKFFVSGKVNRPGAYPVEEQMTLIQAITLAGGFLEPDSSGTVKLLRTETEEKGFEIMRMSISEILAGGHLDVTIVAGDTLVVSSDKFFVYGEVLRPGRYPLESHMTALNAISMAGGFTKFGSPSKVKVLRINEEKGVYDSIQVNINDVISGTSRGDLLLKPGDIVVASESRF